MDPRSTYKPGVHGPPVFLEKVGGPPVWWTPSFLGAGLMDPRFGGPQVRWTPGLVDPRPNQGSIKSDGPLVY